MGRCWHAALAFAVLLVVGCGPVSEGGDDAPAFLVADPEVLDFQAEEDTETLLVKNTGDKSTDFQLAVSAESGGVSWLKVEPEGGTLSGSDAKAVSVKVRNRDLLIPGSYEGKITVQGTGLEPVVVQVSMVVGQPALAVEPGDVLDFGAGAVTKSLIVKNVGSGRLVYAVQLPGAWVSTDAVLQKEITSNEPQNLTLAIDRSQVPWYGDGADQLVVTSNGLDDGANSSTATVDIKVFVDLTCEVDANCIKPGYYCNNGECTGKKLNGQACGDGSDCQSGFCADGFCCESACEGECVTCAAAEQAGSCVPVGNGTACDDGGFCTVDESCTDGECGGGKERDCSELDSECSEGVCDEESDSCQPGGTEGEWCVIKGSCVENGKWNPEATCQKCDTSLSATEWSLESVTCLIDDVCYEMGDPVGGECKVCNPTSPHEASEAGDGTPCTEDGNTCTSDLCMDGVCQHKTLTTGPCDDGNPCTKDDQCDDGMCAGEFYGCDDGLMCTDDKCDGEGGCLFEVEPGTCLIGGTCYQGNEVKEGTFGCMACKPLVALDEWTAVDDSTACNDGNGCTLLDHCEAGACVGTVKECDDELGCTVDACEPETGECQHERVADWCIIEGKCQLVDVHPPGADSGCLVCDPYADPNAWTTINEGLPCNDGSKCTGETACQAGACVEAGGLCDDGLSCTEDGCDPETGCSHEVMAGTCLIDGECYSGNDVEVGSHGCKACKPLLSQEAWTSADDGVNCSDDDACTQEDKCNSGQCVGVSKECGDGLDCTADSCEAESGECLHERDVDWCIVDGACFVVDAHPEGPDAGCLVCDPYNKPDAWTAVNEGFPCDDGMDCTDSPVCEAGVCMQKGPLCDDGNACTTDGCDDDGKCLNEVLEDGTGCPVDENECTDDKCLSGVCEHPAKAGKCVIDGVCFDNNQVHPEHTCAACKVALSQVAWTPVNEGGGCDDGQFCTDPDECVTGMCMGEERDCGKSECKDSWCSEDLDKCFYSNLEDGFECDDGDVCTLGDQCVSGECAGESRDCSDVTGGNPCKVGVCDAQSEPEPGACVAENVFDGTECDDELFCTVDDICLNGICGGESRVCVAADCYAGVCLEESDECVEEVAEEAVGLPCDDGDVCTADTVCGEDGSCGSGTSVSPDECLGILGSENPCMTATCISGVGCQLVQLSDGSPCDLDNASGECIGGECGVAECDAGWGDCNEDPEDGCEHDVLADDDNCGSCDNLCVGEEFCEDGWCVIDCGALTFCMGECVNVMNDARHCDGCGEACEVEDPTLVGVCLNSTCYDTSCPGGYLNADLKTGTGCEYQCTVTNEGVEICDDKDNDCDTKVDEDFTLWNDINNCGECGNVCGPYAHTLYELCVGGECAIGECQENWADEDGDPLTGCEEMLVPEVIWVDAGNAGDQYANGSELHPYSTLGDALAVAEGYEHIMVKNGVYFGPTTVSVVGVTIEGESRDGVFFSTGTLDKNFTISGDDVTLKSMTVTKGILGVYFTAVEKGRLEDLYIHSVYHNTNTTPEVRGILLANSHDIEIVDCEVRDVRSVYVGGTCAACVHTVAGIKATGVTGLTITGTKVVTVRGMRNPYAIFSKYPCQASGIQLQNTSNITISDCTIGDVESGEQYSCQGAEYDHAPPAFGIQMQGSTSLSLNNTVIYGIRGNTNCNDSSHSSGQCLAVSSSSGGVTIAHVTFVGSEQPSQYGVVLDSSVTAPVTMRDSIVSDMTKMCLYNHNNNPTMFLTAAFGNHNNCGDKVHNNAQLDASCFAVTPGFLDGANNDYHLTSGSPCVDAGKPASDYCNEPEPNGCRANIGAYGNTSQAASIDGAEHCGCE